MDIEKDFSEIANYAHMWHWLPDWTIVEDIYKIFPDAYSVLTPFAYTYLEELIRSLTSDYIKPIQDKDGKSNKRVEMKLINLAISENDNEELINMLQEYKKYFGVIKETDRGDNRNSVNHGIMHPNTWTKESFEKLIHDIARISKYAKF